jgi:hypothetical protein
MAIASPLLDVCFVASFALHLTVRSMHINLGYPDHTVNVPRLRRALNGIGRVKSSHRQPRLPITIELLFAISVF